MPNIRSGMTDHRTHYKTQDDYHTRIMTHYKTQDNVSYPDHDPWYAL